MMKPRKPTPKTAGRPVMLRFFLLSCLLAASLLAGAAAYLVVKNMVLSLAGYGGPGGPSLQAGQAQVTPGAPAPSAGEPGSGPASQAPIAPSLKPWDGAKRVTILLLGLDYRTWETGIDYNRSDTMILLTLDPQTKQAGILSVPRDLWTPIPGYQHGKINTAYYLGEAHKLPGGGPALAVKTVEQFLGVTINYYAQIDFGAFVQFIDEIGGVEIDVPAKITIDLLGGGPKTKKTLQPGRQVLPGEWALAYARARHTEGGDFDRARRQQQVIMAIRERILSLNMLPTLISKAPALYGQLASGIHTNLSLDQILQLAVLAQGVPDENIQRGVIGEEYVSFGWSPDNLSILIPKPDKIALLRDQVFAATSSLRPATPGEALAQMQAEAAGIAVLDGSGAGLANRTASYLRGQGANVLQVGQADQTYSGSVLIDHTGNPFALKYLAGLLGVPAGRIYSQYDPAAPAEVEVILGSDWARSNPLP